MKKQLLFSLCILLAGLTSSAQLTGTYTIGGTAFPTTLKKAIDSLNSVGVGPGGVIFNLPVGYSETFINSTDGRITTTTSDAIRPIILQKDGEGDNPVITAGEGSSANTDAIITIMGTDYVTLDGITFQENPANLTTVKQMEMGIWLGRPSGSNGTQHTTIKNCTIQGLLRTMSISSNQYSLSWVAQTVTSFDGTNSYNKFYNNVLHNTSVPASGNKQIQQFYFTTSSNVTTSGFYDEYNEIGGAEGGNYLVNCAILYAYGQRHLRIENNQIFTVDQYAQNTTSSINTSGCPRIKILNNTIRDFTVVSTISGYTGMVVNSSDSVEVIGNTIQNINRAVSTTGSFTGIDFNTGAYYLNFSNNKIKNIICGGASTTTGSFTGISIQSGNMMANSLCKMSYNEITNNAITSSSASATAVFLKNTWYGWSSQTFNNIISDNTVSMAGTITAMDLQCITANLIEKRVDGNVISNFTCTNGTFYGMRHNNGLRTYFYRNRISNINFTGTSNPIIYGISVENSTTATVNIFNNYIYELRATKSGGNRQITALNVVAGQMVDAFYNTIFLDAASTATNFGTAAIYASTSTILKLRNNIITNVSIPSGTGKTIALYLSSASLGNLDPASNNNDYYAGSPTASNLIFYDGTNSDQTLTDFQARVFPSENASVVGLPPFTNVSTSPYIMNLTGASQCESAAQPIDQPEKTVDDFYGNSRYPYPGYPADPSFQPVNPDIGAEEYAGTIRDFTAPFVSFTPLTNTPDVTERTLNTVITDISGVPTAGSGMPVLYWKINNGLWNAVTGIIYGPNKYRFTLGGGVAMGDSVKYFIMAQDNVVVPAPNVGSTPAGATGCTPDPPSFVNPPAKPFSYKILENLCGIYTVGVGGNFTTLTAAMADLNSKSISCPVTYLLMDATYPSETFPILINNIQGASETNTITIKPGPGVSPVIAGSNPVSIITFNGSKYVTIDGSNSGARDRSLLIWNSDTTAASGQTAVFFSSPGGFNNGASYCTLKNCKVKGKAHLTKTTYGIRTNSSTGGGYTNLVIDNNQVYSARLGIRIQGTLAYPAKKCQVINNDVGTAVDSLSIVLYGIYNLYADSTLIQGNDVMGPSQYGNSQYIQTGIFAYTLATNTRIIGNKIHGFYNNATYYGVIGIEYRAEAYSTTEISNNVIYDLKAPGASTIYQDLSGISILNGGKVKIWNNSVNLTGAYLTSASVTRSACIVLSNSVWDLDIRNNILKNSLTETAGTSVGKTYGISSQGNSSAFTALDYNDYYVNGVNPNIGVLNNTVDYPTLFDWQHVTNKEDQSLNIDPQFTSNNYLLPTTSAMPHAGVHIPQVTVDINGVIRANPPDIGAYEFTSNPLVTTSTATVTYNSAHLTGIANARNYTMDLFFDYSLTTAYGFSVAATPASVSDTVTTPISADIAGLDPSTTYHYRARGVTSGGIVIYGSDKTFTTDPLPVKDVILRAFLEGLYAGSGTMNQAMDEYGAHFGTGVADQVMVEIHNAIDYSDIVFTAGPVDIATNGEIHVNTIPATYSDSYFITIKHRNSIQTTSASPVSFAAGSINYDFTSGGAQAFGNNLKDVGGGNFAIWGGDVNQDGIVDSGDMNPVDNLSTAITFGYVAEDVNGDGIVDSGDMNIVDNNSTAIIMAQLP
jgi:trimeric autotransporter adhesin